MWRPDISLSVVVPFAFSHRIWALFTPCSSLYCFLAICSQFPSFFCLSLRPGNKVRAIKAKRDIIISRYISRKNLPSHDCCFWSDQLHSQHDGVCSTALLRAASSPALAPVLAPAPGMIPSARSCSGKGLVPEMLLAPVDCVHHECHLGVSICRPGSDGTSGVQDSVWLWAPQRGARSWAAGAARVGSRPPGFALFVSSTKLVRGWADLSKYLRGRANAELLWWKDGVGAGTNRSNLARSSLRVRAERFGVASGCSQISLQAMGGRGWGLITSETQCNWLHERGGRTEGWTQC